MQTLSRVNRIHPDKDGTFVLDFVNEAGEVADEFERYHGMTVAPPSDPNLLYDTRHDLDEYGVLDVDDATTFQQALLRRMDRNEKVVFRFLDDPDLAADVVRMYQTLAQARLRVAYQEHCPIGELLSPDGEGAHLEYKSTLRTGKDSGEVYRPLETATIKTVAAFANSEEGGTLLLGVASDYASLHTEGKDDRDQFMLHLNQVLINAVGETVASRVSTKIYKVNGGDLCRVHVQPSAFPVDATVTVEKSGQFQKKAAFYVRIGNATREITDPVERQRYIATRWGAGFPGQGTAP